MSYMQEIPNDVVLLTDVNHNVGYAKYAGTWRIATELRRLNANVKIIECFTSFTEQQVLTLIDLYVCKQTKFVGISTTLLHGEFFLGFRNNFFAEIKSAIHKKNPNCKLVLGGSRVNDFLNVPGVDIYVAGKADISVKQLYQSLCSNTSMPERILNTDYPVSSDYFSSTTIKFTHTDDITWGESLPLEIARGCIFKCSFCQYDLIGKRKGDYIKDPETLKNELIYNWETFGTTDYLFTDELINESKEKVDLLHSIFTKLPFKISWSAYARLDLFYAYRDMRDKLLEMGAAGLVFGIETLDETAGKLVKKGLGKNRIFETLDHLSETYNGQVVMSSNFIIGLPTETKSSLYQTFEWLNSEDCPLDVFSFTPLNLRNADDGRQMNEISLNPDKFGYSSVGTEGNKLIWENENISYNESLEILNHFRNENKFSKKAHLGSGNMLGRIKNLGFTIEDTKKQFFEPDNTVDWQAMTNKLITKKINKYITRENI